MRDLAVILLAAAVVFLAVLEHLQSCRISELQGELSHASNACDMAQTKADRAASLVEGDRAGLQSSARIATHAYDVAVAVSKRLDPKFEDRWDMPLSGVTRGDE